jgi:Protein of unknown function (DUF1553)/Protein of unknown function (DUF1549)/Planctomycete cytochrome C
MMGISGVRTPFVCTLIVLALGGLPLGASDPDFTNDVRPILVEYCFSCHGPDAARRKADLRLDSRQEAIDHGALVPGQPEQSEVIRRLSDAKRQMPPPASGKVMPERAKEILRRWVAAGAEYATHWAFAPARMPPVPVVQRTDWPVNPIDNFVLAELEGRRWEPTREAERPVLLRRLSLALTGLPPTIEELDTFAADSRPDAIEKQVDRLLASPRFGEHLARHWLDAARYGDTHGLHIDNFRSIFPYRDWVIRAFQENMPYDRFLIEQLAGDLLPRATLSQQVATGFLRCNVSTNECGTIEAEAEVRNLHDRVDTVGQAVLGLTLGCAKCHDHKYDPIPQTDYYALAAFFNNIDGSAKDGNRAAHQPTVRLGAAADLRRLEELDAKLDEVRSQIRAAALRAPAPPPSAAEVRLPVADFVWFDHALPEGVKPLVEGPRDRAWEWVLPAEPLGAGRKSVRLEADGPARLALHQAKPGLKVGAGDRLFVRVWIDPKNPPRAITLNWHSDSWRHAIRWGVLEAPAPGRHQGSLPAAGEWTRLEVSAESVGLLEGDLINGWSVEQDGGRTFWNDFGLTTRTPQNEYQTYDTQAQWELAVTQIGLANTHLSDEIQFAIKTTPTRRTPEQSRTLDEFFRVHGYRGNTDVLAELRARQSALRREWEAAERLTTTSLVFRERSALRPSHVLIRGNYDQPGVKVERGTPAALPAFPADAPRNRLGLAAWITDVRNPLASRVAVNRLWQQVFGTGLARTAEDFGTRGEPPSHPALLDWLAATFVADGWDVKTTVRRMVLSRTFRQAAVSGSEAARVDPKNRWLWRGPSFRLDAEVLRDQALFASGLLVEKVGGPPVKPPQPPGLWEAVAIPGSDTGVFVADRGVDKIYRRSVYTFWKRTAPPPQFAILDAPTREACIVRRERTTTPLQALLLMNDETYVAAARELAGHAIRSSPADDARLTHMFRHILCRPPTDREADVLRQALRDHRERFRAFPHEAVALVRVGAASTALVPGTEVELAAWTMIGNLLLNLDETVTP